MSTKYIISIEITFCIHQIYLYWVCFYSYVIWNICIKFFSRREKNILYMHSEVFYAKKFLYFLRPIIIRGPWVRSPFKNCCGVDNIANSLAFCRSLNTKKKKYSVNNKYLVLFLFSIQDKKNLGKKYIYIKKKIN